MSRTFLGLNAVRNGIPRLSWSQHAHQLIFHWIIHIISCLQLVDNWKRSIPNQGHDRDREGNRIVRLYHMAFFRLPKTFNEFRRAIR
jgi:hypothetical protein